MGIKLSYFWLTTYRFRDIVKNLNFLITSLFSNLEDKPIMFILNFVGNDLGVRIWDYF